jgi:hypothetical protein
VRLDLEDFEIRLALVALGIADDAERALIDVACAHDRAVARRLGELADVAAALPLALPRARPPPLAL